MSVHQSPTQASNTAVVLPEFSADAKRKFVTATLRTARAKLQSIICEIDEIGVSLRHGMIDAEAAVTWIAYIGADQFINVDPWSTKIEVQG